MVAEQRLGRRLGLRREADQAPVPVRQRLRGARVCRRLGGRRTRRTGLKIYDSGNGGWLLMGGTSLATPLIAAYYAITGLSATTPQWAYTSSALLNDPASGSNGSCAQSIFYICNAARRLRRTHRGRLDLGRGGAPAPRASAVRRSGREPTTPTPRAPRRSTQRSPAASIPTALQTTWWVEYGTDQQPTVSTPRPRTSAIGPDAGLAELDAHRAVVVDDLSLPICRAEQRRHHVRPGLHAAHGRSRLVAAGRQDGADDLGRPAPWLPDGDRARHVGAAPSAATSTSGSAAATAEPPGRASRARPAQPTRRCSKTRAPGSACTYRRPAPAAPRAPSRTAPVPVAMAPPINTGAPAVIGAAQVGATLTAERRQLGSRGRDVHLRVAARVRLRRLPGHPRRDAFRLHRVAK